MDLAIQLYFGDVKSYPTTRVLVKIPHPWGLCCSGTQQGLSVKPTGNWLVSSTHELTGESWITQRTRQRGCCVEIERLCHIRIYNLHDWHSQALSRITFLPVQTGVGHTLLSWSGQESHRTGPEARTRAGYTQSRHSHR